MKSKKFDVIIFGASGYIGKCAVLHAIEILKDFKWAVAGKSEQKMQYVLNDISSKTGKNLNNIKMFPINAHDVEKLEIIVAKCKILVNCSGPYCFLAENIVISCILKGTHYVDMCNDPYFNEVMELKYQEKALLHKVFVVTSCGFHSLPIEMAINFLKQNFEGTLNSVEAFVRYNFGGFFYFPFHSIWSTTSWQSLLWSCVKIADLPIIRDQLRMKLMPCLLPQLTIEELQTRIKYRENGVMVHFPFIDQQSVERSQYMFYSRGNQRPIQFCKYIEFPSFVWAILFIIWCLIVSMLSRFEKTRKILEKYPKMFSLGMFSLQGPESYFLEMSSYKIKMLAKGWSGSSMYPQLEKDDNSIMNQYMTIEISGENPFNDCSCVCLLISAKTILEDHDDMPESGGVFGPGYAFYNTKILKRFQKYSNYFRLKIS